MKLLLMSILAIFAITSATAIGFAQDEEPELDFDNPEETAAPTTPAMPLDAASAPLEEVPPSVPAAADAAAKAKAKADKKSAGKKDKKMKSAGKKKDGGKDKSAKKKKSKKSKKAEKQQG